MKDEGKREFSLHQSDLHAEVRADKEVNQEELATARLSSPKSEGTEDTEKIDRGTSARQPPRDLCILCVLGVLGGKKNGNYLHLEHWRAGFVRAMKSGPAATGDYPLFLCFARAWSTTSRMIASN
jgi:hypothetical protein